jgi:hypothetical protein
MKYSESYPYIEGSERMFVLVRTDLPYVHQAVQAGHAVAQYFVDGNTRDVVFDPSIHDRIDNEYYSPSQYGKTVEWCNGTLIYLAVPNELELMKWQYKLNNWNHPYSMFYEPDWGSEPTATALATLGFRGDFSELRTIRMNKGILSNLFNAISEKFHKSNDNINTIRQKINNSIHSGFTPFEIGLNDGTIYTEISLIAELESEGHELSRIAIMHFSKLSDKRSASGYGVDDATLIRVLMISKIHISQISYIN